jgi:hypothetical protein
LYGLGHALEARKSPERRMDILALNRWYGPLLLVGAALFFPLAFFVHPYFDPVRRIEIKFSPYKTLSTYAVLAGYTYGWYLGKPRKTTTTYMGRKGAAGGEDSESNSVGTDVEAGGTAEVESPAEEIPALDGTPASRR